MQEKKAQDYINEVKTTLTSAESCLQQACNKWTEFTIKLPNIIYEDAMLINEYTDLQNYIKGTRVEFSDIYLKQNI